MAIGQDYFSNLPEGWKVARQREGRLGDAPSQPGFTPMRAYELLGPQGETRTVTSPQDLYSQIPDYNFRPAPSTRGPGSELSFLYPAQDYPTQASLQNRYLPPDLSEANVGPEDYGAMATLAQQYAPGLPAQYAGQTPFNTIGGRALAGAGLPTAAPNTRAGAFAGANPDIVAPNMPRPASAATVSGMDRIGGSSNSYFPFAQSLMGGGGYASQSPYQGLLSGGLMGGNPFLGRPAGGFDMRALLLQQLFGGGGGFGMGQFGGYPLGL